MPQMTSEINEEQVLGLITRIYDAALDPSRWGAFLDDLAGVYRGTAVISTQGELGSGARIHAASGLDPAFSRSYEQYYSQARPWAAKVDTATRGQLFTLGWLIDESDYERCEYFNDWRKPQGIYHLFSAALDKDGPASTFL